MPVFEAGMLEKLLAVVGGEHHEGLVEEAALLEPLEEPRQLRVEGGGATAVFGLDALRYVSGEQTETIVSAAGSPMEVVGEDEVVYRRVGGEPVDLYYKILDGELEQRLVINRRLAAPSLTGDGVLFEAVERSLNRMRAG